MIRVHLSSHFHQYTEGVADTTANGRTIDDIVRDLDRQYPGIRFRMIDEQDRIRKHINVFIGREKAQSINDEVKPETEIHILAAISGG